MTIPLSNSCISVTILTIPNQLLIMVDALEDYLWQCSTKLYPESSLSSLKILLILFLFSLPGTQSNISIIVSLLLHAPNWSIDPDDDPVTDNIVAFVSLFFANHLSCVLQVSSCWILTLFPCKHLPYHSHQTICSSSWWGVLHTK